MSIKVSRGPFLELEVQNGLATTTPLERATSDYYR